MTFTRKQTAKMIGISLRTLDRHIAAGKLAVERTPATDYFEQTVSISLAAIGQYLGIADETQLRARLGLPKIEQPAPEESPAPEQPSVSASEPEPSTPPPSNCEQRILADLAFAEKYRNGEVPDSFGNYFGSSTGVTALGPHPEQIPGFSPDSQRDLRYQPIRFHQPSKPRVQRKSGYGLTQQDIDEESAALAAQRHS